MEELKLKQNRPTWEDLDTEIIFSQYTFNADIDEDDSIKKMLDVLDEDERKEFILLVENEKITDVSHILGKTVYVLKREFEEIRQKILKGNGFV